MLEAIQSYVPQLALASGILQTEVQGWISRPDVRSAEDGQPFRRSAREPGLQTGHLAARAYTQSGNTEEGLPHGSPSIEHHCIWLPTRHLYTAGIGTAIEVDARARSSTHLKPGTFPLASLNRASLLQISGFSLNIASALPCRLYGIPDSPSSFLILPYGAALLHQRAEESIAFQSGVAESTVLQMMTMQQTISRGPGMAPVKAPNTTAQAE